MALSKFIIIIIILLLLLIRQANTEVLIDVIVNFCFSWQLSLSVDIEECRPIGEEFKDAEAFKNCSRYRLKGQ